MSQKKPKHVDYGSYYVIGDDIPDTSIDFDFSAYYKSRSYVDVADYSGGDQNITPKEPKSAPLVVQRERVIPSMDASSLNATDDDWEALMESGRDIGITALRQVQEERQILHEIPSSAVDPEVVQNVYELRASTDANTAPDVVVLDPPVLQHPIDDKPLTLKLDFSSASSRSRRRRPTESIAGDEHTPSPQLPLEEEPPVTKQDPTLDDYDIDKPMTEEEFRLLFRSGSSPLSLFSSPKPSDPVELEVHAGQNAGLRTNDASSGGSESETNTHDDVNMNSPPAVTREMLAKAGVAALGSVSVDTDGLNPENQVGESSAQQDQEDKDQEEYSALYLSLEKALVTICTSLVSSFPTASAVVPTASSVFSPTSATASDTEPVPLAALRVSSSQVHVLNLSSFVTSCFVPEEVQHTPLASLAPGFFASDTLPSAASHPLLNTGSTGLEVLNFIRNTWATLVGGTHIPVTIEKAKTDTSSVASGESPLVHEEKLVRRLLRAHVEPISCAANGPTNLPHSTLTEPPESFLTPITAIPPAILPYHRLSSQIAEAISFEKLSSIVMHAKKAMTIVDALQCFEEDQKHYKDNEKRRKQKIKELERMKSAQHPYSLDGVPSIEDPWDDWENPSKRKKKPLAKGFPLDGKHGLRVISDEKPPYDVKLTDAKFEIPDFPIVYQPLPHSARVALSSDEDSDRGVGNSRSQGKLRGVYISGSDSSDLGDHDNVPSVLREKREAFARRRKAKRRASRPQAGTQNKRKHDAELDSRATELDTAEVDGTTTRTMVQQSVDVLKERVVGSIARMSKETVQALNTRIRVTKGQTETVHASGSGDIATTEDHAIAVSTRKKSKKEVDHTLAAYDDIVYPLFSRSEGGGQDGEDAADEVEQPVEVESELESSEEELGWEDILELEMASTNKICDGVDDVEDGGASDADVEVDDAAFDETKQHTRALKVNKTAEEKYGSFGSLVTLEASMGIQHFILSTMNEAYQQLESESLPVSASLSKPAQMSLETLLAIMQEMSPIRERFISCLRTQLFKALTACSVPLHIQLHSAAHVQLNAQTESSSILSSLASLMESNAEGTSATLTEDTGDDATDSPSRVVTVDSLAPSLKILEELASHCVDESQWMGRLRLLEQMGVTRPAFFHSTNTTNGPAGLSEVASDSESHGTMSLGLVMDDSVLHQSMTEYLHQLLSRDTHSHAFEQYLMASIRAALNCAANTAQPSSSTNLSSVPVTFSFVSNVLLLPVPLFLGDTDTTAQSNFVAGRAAGIGRVSPWEGTSVLLNDPDAKGNVFSKAVSIIEKEASLYVPYEDARLLEDSEVENQISVFRNFVWFLTNQFQFVSSRPLHPSSISHHPLMNMQLDPSIPSLQLGDVFSMLHDVYCQLFRVAPMELNTVLESSKDQSFFEHYSPFVYSRSCLLSPIHAVMNHSQMSCKVTTLLSHSQIREGAFPALARLLANEDYNTSSSDKQLYQRVYNTVLEQIQVDELNETASVFTLSACESLVSYIASIKEAWDCSQTRFVILAFTWFYYRSLVDVPSNNAEEYLAALVQKYQPSAEKHSLSSFASSVLRDTSPQMLYELILASEHASSKDPSSAGVPWALLALPPWIFQCANDILDLFIRFFFSFSNLVDSEAHNQVSNNFSKKPFCSFFAPVSLVPKTLVLVQDYFQRFAQRIVLKGPLAIATSSSALATLGLGERMPVDSPISVKKSVHWGDNAVHPIHSDGTSESELIQPIADDLDAEFFALLSNDPYAPEFAHLLGPGDKQMVEDALEPVPSLALSVEHKPVQGPEPSTGPNTYDTMPQAPIDDSREEPRAQTLAGDINSFGAEQLQNILRASGLLLSKSTASSTSKVGGKNPSVLRKGSASTDVGTSTALTSSVIGVVEDYEDPFLAAISSPFASGKFGKGEVNLDDESFFDSSVMDKIYAMNMGTQVDDVISDASTDSLDAIEFVKANEINSEDSSSVFPSMDMNQTLNTRGGKSYVNSIELIHSPISVDRLENKEVSGSESDDSYDSYDSYNVPTDFVDFSKEYAIVDKPSYNVHLSSDDDDRILEGNQFEESEINTTSSMVPVADASRSISASPDRQFEDTRSMQLVSQSKEHGRVVKEKRLNPEDEAQQKQFVRSIMEEQRQLFRKLDDFLLMEEKYRQKQREEAEKEVVEKYMKPNAVRENKERATRLLSDAQPQMHVEQTDELLDVGHSAATESPTTTTIAAASTAPFSVPLSVPLSQSSLATSTATLPPGFLEVNGSLIDMSSLRPEFLLALQAKIDKTLREKGFNNSMADNLDAHVPAADSASLHITVPQAPPAPPRKAGLRSRKR